MMTKSAGSEQMKIISCEIQLESDVGQRCLRNDNTISESDNGNCRLFEEI